MRESILTIPISEILEPMQDCAARGKKFNAFICLRFLPVLFRWIFLKEKISPVYFMP